MHFPKLLVVLLAWAMPLCGQYKLCFPSTTWFGSSSGPNLASLKVDDPGWFGSFRYVFGDGTGSQYAVVQGIRDSSNNLYLSFEAEGLTSLSSTTVVELAFDFRKMPSDTGPLWKIVLRPVHNPPSNPPSNSASALVADSGVRELYSGMTNGAGVATWTQQLPTPTWLQAPNNPVGYWGTSGNYNWFLETEIPSANLPVPTTQTFGLYVNIFRVVGTQYQESWWPPTATNYEPGCAPGTVVGGCTPGTQTPEPGVLMTAYNWGRSTIDPAESCKGVSVGSQVNDIFTNNTPNSVICAHPGPSASCTATPNIFTAKVTNNTVNGSGAAQPAPNVRATFSIANFGLNGPWDSSQWTKISPLTSNPTAATTLPTNSTTPLATGSWTVPNPNDYDPTVAGSHPHQCIMATLDSTSGNVDFINNAAFQNMDIVHASRFERTAEINAKGYPPRPDNADGTHNTDQLFDIHIITSQEILHPGQTNIAYTQQGTPGGQGAGMKRDQIISQLTWRAQGCRHTGRYMTVDHRKIEVCDPLTGFGYIVRHVGKSEVKRWKVRFSGAGLVAVPGQENTYQIHVPQEGVATVTTFAEPEEGGGSGPGGPGRFALFLDAGGNFPHGTFGQAFDHGFSLNAGLEYILASHFSVEGIFGYHRFPGTITPDLNIYQFSGNGKVYLTTGTFQPFVNGGVGGYRFSIGSGSSSTYFGGNVGGGVLYNLTSRFGLQGSYNFHVVNTPVEATKFSTAQGGIRFVF